MSHEPPRQVAYCRDCQQHHDLGRIDMVAATLAADWWLRHHDCPGPPAQSGRSPA